MGRALAAFLADAPEDNREPLGDLLNAETTELPAETEIRPLIEAAGLDADAAIAAARTDGDRFDGDEQDGGEETSYNGGRVLEAVGAGARPGTVRRKVVVIRPGQARGPGKRFYTPKMLEANALNFGGQPVFYNHEDLDVILKRGHGSRDPRDLAGWLQEGTWWDPTYSEPDDKKHKRLPGAVMGHTDFRKEAADLANDLPEALAMSVNMDSTRIRVGRTPVGTTAPLVEGVIKGSGSLDLITGAAGAGGKLVGERLRESSDLGYGSAHGDLDQLDDDRIVEALRERPDLAERLGVVLPDDAPIDPPEGDPVSGAAETTKLIEAVASDEATATRLVEALAGTDAFSRVVEAHVAEAREEGREEGMAETNRLLDLRDLRDEAHRLIEARSVAKGGILTPAFVDDLRERYVLRDGRTPSPALDVHDVLGEGGVVQTTARERLVEAVEADILREEAKLREAAPTRLRSLSPPAPDADPSDGDTPPTDENGRVVEAAEKDPLAEKLGLDTSKVREHQGVGA